MQAYLRQSLLNRIRDEVRRVSLRPSTAIPADQPTETASPLETAIQHEAYERYREALVQLRSEDRELIVAKVEAQWSMPEIAQRFGFPTPEAASKAVARALVRLADHMKSGEP
jgi:RNA polymerase sigma factor (sigma-70 family)